MMEPIELVGEANPLSRDNLVRNLALGASRSAGNQELQTATRQLQEWEGQSAFYVQLQAIFIDQGLPFEVRYLAILQLLHAVTNKLAWGNRGSTGITKSDKSRIRSNLLVAGYREPDDRLARQNALLTAKIVRSDFPREWPNVFDDLNATTTGSFEWQNPVHILQMRRALDFLHCVVKELAKASLRLANLRAKAPELLGPVCEIFLGCSNRLPNQLSTDSYSIDESNAIGLLVPSTGIIRRLLVKGYSDPHRDNRVRSAWTMVLQFFAPRTQLLANKDKVAPSNSQRLLEKSVLQVAKLHLEVAEDNLTAFLLLPHSLDLVKAYWDIIKHVAQTYGADPIGAAQLGMDADASDEATPLVEKLALRGLLILRACLKLLSDPGSIKMRSEHDTADKIEALRLLQNNVFTPVFVQEVLHIIINQFFVFRASDLKRWEDEPDEWEAAEGGDTEGFRYSLRLSTEKLFLDLTNKYTTSVVPNILQLVNTTVVASGTVPQKESTYTALGLAADKIFVFSESQDRPFKFVQILPTLVADLHISNDLGYRLIRRRIAILLGKWIHIQVPKNSRPTVYEIFRLLLDNTAPLNDLVVRVTAGRQLKEIVADWEFDAEIFLPYAPDLLSKVMGLISEVELPETKMGLLETVSTLVENLGQHIAPFADHIVSVLPSLWDETGEETLRKQVIVTLLVNMFASMGTASQQYQDFALFIIKAVLSDQSTLPQLERMALLPDALDLWRAVLDNTPNTSVDQLHPDLLGLLKTSLIPTLSLDSEARRAALEITSAYFLLIPKEFLSEQSFIIEMLRSQASELRCLKPEASAQVFEVVEQLVRAADDFAGVSGVQTIAEAMMQSSFFPELIYGLNESYEAHQTSGPKARVSHVQGQVETDFFALLARIAYVSPELFADLIRKVDTNSNTSMTMSWLLEEWFSHAQDMISEPPRQKLMAMALSRLVALGEPYILERLQQMMDLWISTIENLTDGNDDKSVDSLVYPAADAANFVPGEGQSAGEARKAALSSTDPVHRVNLLEVVKYAVATVVERCGGPERFQREWLVNVDKEIVQQFGKLGII